eukprot:CAMPEP_0204548948 /NCGR_PEP_ID=MMETSP0661-20131031/23958_1 /ASSEMBLY_ACC=CAM_ASM_000606 /TAXON_ID=109239 /ORGANISM="Alexandrium margalefi, Strain AMGDE01CS-322" /LENGTH=529 /DNA_ID=CAMNT_0051555869 /DNA_START=58 /DNA_END=1647 /DNA_ORIENTATION=+
MTDADPPEQAVDSKAENGAAPAASTEAVPADSTEAPAEDAGPPPEERVELAEAAKETGNSLLKAGDSSAAAAKYQEGIELTEPLLGKDPSEIGEDLQRRGVAVHVALRLNCAQACIKQSVWIDAIEHASKVLLIDKDNAKALYRRGLAAVQLDSESRLEQARADFARVAQLDPSNREAREQLQRVKERLKDMKQREKERLSAAMKGGLYQEQHDKLGKQQAAYEEEVARRKEAGEDDISFEDWTKKEKEKEDDRKKKQKEEMEKQREEARKEEERKRWSVENAQRASDGLPELTLEEWQAQRRAPAAREDVVQADEGDLDEEERKLLQEAKSKGYYHGRLGTVLSSAAPTPQQVSVDASPSAPSSGHTGSEWNQAGTWEEKDTTAWVKERLTACLQSASVSMPEALLPSGAAAAMTAKVTKVKSLTGEGQIITVRKQLRHGYNFEADLSFSITVRGTNGDSSEETFNGALRLPDLMDAVQPQDLKMEGRWKGSGPPEHLRLPAEGWADKLRESVRSQVVAFRKEYAERR